MALALAFASVELTDAERSTLLRALFELWSRSPRSISIRTGTSFRSVAKILRDQIEVLVRKLGGDRDAPLFGSDL